MREMLIAFLKPSVIGLKIGFDFLYFKTVIPMNYRFEAKKVETASVCITAPNAAWIACIPSVS